jgi:hypothetical protein|tara:strand:+ start:468 stop:608 length:141 start_codon:yes stop_codon:yes gene_type:complete
VAKQNKKEKHKEVDLRKSSKKKLIVSSVLLGLCLAGMIIIGEVNAR